MCAHSFLVLSLSIKQMAFIPFRIECFGIVGNTEQHDAYFNLNIVHSGVDFILFLMFDRTGNKTEKTTRTPIVFVENTEL